MNKIKWLLRFVLVITIISQFILLAGCQEGKHFAKGYDLYKQDKYDEAVVEFSKTLELDPNHPDANDYRGRCYFYLQQYDLAIADLSVAIGRNPKDADHYYYRGMCYLYLKQYDLAITDLGTAIGYNPKNAYYYYYRAYAYLNKNSGDLAATDFNKAITLSNDITLTQDANKQLNQLDNKPKISALAITWNTAGVELANKGENDDAITAYTRALEIEPSYTVAYRNRGLAYISTGQYANSVLDLSNAIKIDPNYAEAYSIRGLAYLYNEQYKEATTDLAKATELDATDAGAWNNQGVALDLLGEQDAAIRCYDKALSLDPNNDSATKNKASAGKIRGNHAVIVPAAILDFTYADVTPSLPSANEGTPQGGAGIQIDYAALAREIANNYMYSGKIEMRKALAQLLGSTISSYSYTVQEPQHIAGEKWQVPVKVFFAVKVPASAGGYTTYVSASYSGLEMLTIDVKNESVLSEVLVSYSAN